MEEQKCRICGCTDSDCTQCIKITGKPCHWVEPDLCSACADAIANQQKANDMNFFQQLSASGDIDMTLRIMQKGDQLTLNVMPGSISAKVKPFIVTGTAVELDEAFFSTVMPGAAEIKGLVTNLEEVKESAQKSKSAASAKKAPAAKPAAKKKAVAKGPSAKKSAAKKAPADKSKWKSPVKKENPAKAAVAPAGEETVVSGPKPLFADDAE